MLNIYIIIDLKAEPALNTGFDTRNAGKSGNEAPEGLPGGFGGTSKAAEPAV